MASFLGPIILNVVAETDPPGIFCYGLVQFKSERVRLYNYDGVAFECGCPNRSP